MQRSCALISVYDTGQFQIWRCIYLDDRYVELISLSEVRQVKFSSSFTDYRIEGTISKNLFVVSTALFTERTDGEYSPKYKVILEH